MIKKIVFRAVTLIICIALLCACSSGIWYKVSYHGEGGFGFNETDQAYFFSAPAIVKSLDELKALCDEWENPAFQESSEYYSTEINQKIRSYDEEFFEEKALIINSFWGNESIKISSLSIEEAQLTVNIGRKKGAYKDVAKSWFFLIEVKKADIASVTTVQINRI